MNMSFNKFNEDVSNGISRPIKSRKHGILISKTDFIFFSNKYFKNLNKSENFKFTVDKKHIHQIIFMLRCFYNLWIEVENYSIKIFKDFPLTFIITKEVNKLNHPHIPENFNKNTVMYFSKSKYSVCNWLKGIPLWKDQNDIDGIIPSCQINYSFIKPLNKN